MSFTGFPDEALAFYDGLEADNSKAYWADHKATYDACVRGPMQELVAALEPEFGPAKVFRPFRDVRFARDKSPYKTHQGAFTGTLAGTGLYVQISADGLLVAGGFYTHTPRQVERFRAAVDDAGSGERLVALVAELDAAGFAIGGDRMKTRPRGFPEEHPRIDLLRHRSLTASRDFGAPPWLSTPACLDQVAATWRQLGPLNDWLEQHVGT